MHYFQLLLSETIWPFPLRPQIGNKSLEQRTRRAVAQMFASINNYLMHVLQELRPEGSAISGEY